MRSPGREKVHIRDTLYNISSVLLFFASSIGIVRPCNASRFSLSKRSFLKRRRKSKPAMRGVRRGRSLRRWNQGETFRMKLQRAPGRVIPEWYNSPVRYMSSYAVDTARSRGCAFSMRGTLLSSKSIRASMLPCGPSACRENREKKGGVRLRNVRDEGWFGRNRARGETDGRAIAKMRSHTSETTNILINVIR